MQGPGIRPSAGEAAMIAMLEKIGDRLIGRIVPAVPVKAAVEWREQCACDNFTSRT